MATVRRPCDELFKQIDRLSRIKYATYRLAHKVELLQRHLKVPDTRLIAGVFARHRLSTSEGSLTLEPCELEAVLTDVYFAAEKEGSFVGNVDGAAETTLSFLLMVYAGNETSSVSVQSAKTALIVLSDDTNRRRWRSLFSIVADHNGCVSPRRLSSLLTQIALLAEHVGEGSSFGQHLIGAEVDRCFSKTPGMLGLSEYGLLEWIEGESSPHLLSWMEVRTRLHEAYSILNNEKSDTLAVQWKCSICNKRNPIGLKFKCSKCWGMMICEQCYLYNDIKSSPTNDLSKHKKSHVIKEIIDSQGVSSRRFVSIMKNVKKMLILPSSCRRGHNSSMEIQYPLEEPINAFSEDQSVNDNINDKLDAPNVENKHKIITSTVGKANGKNITDSKVILRDIIIKLENQNRALQNLSSVLNNPNNKDSTDHRIQSRIENHFSQISAQINRLKILQDSLFGRLSNWEGNTVDGQSGNVSMKRESEAYKFEALSPIPLMSKDCTNESTIMEQKNINSITGRHLLVENSKPKNDINKNADSISHVSMSDISMWYGNDMDSESNLKEKPRLKSDIYSRKHLGNYQNDKESAVSEDKFNADIESVASSNNKMKELNADLDSVLDRLQTILTNNFALDEINFDNTQLQETANEMEGLLGSLIRGVEQRRTKRGDKI